MKKNKIKYLTIPSLNHFYDDTGKLNPTSSCNIEMIFHTVQENVHQPITVSFMTNWIYLNITIIFFISLTIRAKYVKMKI
jgi:hypothetical protein